MRRKFGYRFQLRLAQVTLAIAVIFLSIACSDSIQTPLELSKRAVPATELNIWWEQGYNLEEDEALRTIVNDWQAETGNQVKLSFFTNDELTAKAERAVKANQTPDLMMTLKGDRILYSRLAWHDRLEDVTDVIEPVKDAFAPNILEAIAYSNPLQEKRSYYGIPIHQSTIFIFYWQKLLALIGLKPQDIPQDWDGFWQFWQQAQLELRAKQNLDIYGLGFSLAPDKRADDTHYLFEQILEAYDVALFDEQEQLIIDRPKVRQGIIDCLKWYAQLYQQGYIPPEAIQWSNIDNNRSLLNRLVLMTPNATLSIPATVRQDADTYYHQLAVSEFPNKPSGQPMRYLISVRQAVIFKDAPHKSLAKDFVRYLIQPQVIDNYLKASGIRHQPVQTQNWSDPFWQDTQDPYLAVATKILTTGQTRLSYAVKHPAYCKVLAENIWGQALIQVTRDRVSPEVATDKAIARIKEIFRLWGD